MADLASTVMGFEGFTPRASWDYKQHSNGYGTRARYPGEVIDQNEARQRLATELESARNSVAQKFPNLQPHQQDALTSFTYNVGPAWMSQPTRLASAVASGDHTTAAEVMKEYNKAGGQVLPGLASRRNSEAAMYLGGEALANQPQSSQQQAQPMPSLSYQPTPEPSGNFFDRLGDTMQSPLFMMGAGVMSGPTIGAGLISGAEAAQKGAQAKLIQQELMRKRAQEQNRDAMWQGLFQSGDIDNVLKGYPGITKQALFAMGPDQGSQLIGKLASGKGDQQFQLDMLKKQMELKRQEGQQATEDQFNLINRLVNANGAPPQAAMPMVPSSGGVAPSRPSPMPAQAPQQSGAVPAPAMGLVPQLTGAQVADPEADATTRRAMIYSAVNKELGKAYQDSPAYKASMQAAEYRQRAASAKAMGIDENDPDFKAMVINNKLPDVVPDHKAIQEADSKVRQGRKVLDSINLAKQYHEKAYTGYGAGARATLMNNLPLIGSTDESKATADLDTEIMTSMMPQLKAAFPGRITNADIKLFESIQPSSGMTFDQRAKALERAKERTQELVNESLQDAAQLRGRNYYKPGGGVSGGQKTSFGSWGIEKE